MSNPTWKNYGGIRKLDQFNTMSVYSFAADVFTLRQSCYGTFDICGEFHVSGNARVDSNIYGNNLTIINDVSTNRLFVNDITVHDNNVDISGTLYVHSGNTYLMQTLDVSGHIYLRKELYLGNSFNSYLYGTDAAGNIGVNTRTPIASLDISSQYPFAFNVGSKTQSQIYSVPLQNNGNKGFVLSANTTTSRIGFYNDASITSVTNTPDALLQYTTGGFVTLDCSQNINLYSNVSVSNRPSNVNAHVMGEPMVIYDTSSGPYLYSVYENAKEITGNVLSLIANDSSSNTFMNIIAPNRQGISLGGGVYPNDSTRSMGSIGWRDTSANYTPTINVVSGTSRLKQKTTIGINTHGPETETYAFDVNGPIHVKNGELTIVNQPTFEIKQIATGRSSPNYGVAIGSPYKYDSTSVFQYRQQILFTTNGGENWYSNYDSSGDTLERANRSFRCAYVYDSSLSIIAGDDGFAYYTYNGYFQPPGQTWLTIGTPSWQTNASIRAVYIHSSKRVFWGIVDARGVTLYWFDLPINIYTSTSGINSNGVRDGSFNLTGTGSPSIDGCGNVFWVVYGNTIVKGFVNSETNIPTIGPSRTSIASDKTYNTLSAFDSNNVVAAGANVITYTNDGGTTWNDISILGITVNSLRVCDASNAIAVCNAGIVLASNDGYASWFQVSNAALNASGNGNRMFDATYNLSCVAMVNTNNFFVSKTNQPYVNNGPAQSSLFHVYLPNLFNNVTNYVFDLSGSSRISGDLNVNEGGKIASNNQTFHLLKNGVNQIYFGNDASNVYVGSTTLNSKISCNYDVNIAHDLSSNGNIWCNNYIRTSFIDSSGGTFGRDLSPAPTSQYDITIGGQNLQGVAMRNIRIGNFHSPEIIDTSNVVYVSGPNDRLIIQGEMIQSQNVKFGGQYIYLNYGGGIGSSAGSGIYFYDEGSQYAGKVAVSNDRQGFIFKPTENNKRNVVKLDVSNMVIADPLQSTGIVSISRSAALTDSSYSLAVSIIDPSNIMIINKNRSTLPWQQTVDTSLSVFGPVSLGKYSVSNVNYALDISGNVLIAGGNNTIQTSNTIVNNNVSIGKLVSATNGYNLDVSGNILISGGNNTIQTSNTIVNNNVSIGKTVAATTGYNLDVSGNILISGGNNTIQTSNTIVNNNMSIGKTVAATTGYNLDVSGNTKIEGGNVTITSSNTIVNTNMSIGTTVAAATGYTLDVNGNVQIVGGNVTVASSNVFIHKNVSIGKTTSAVSTLDVSGTVAISSNLTANGITISSNGLSVSGTTSGSNTLVVTGNAAISTNLVVSGTAAVTSSLTANGISVSTGGISVSAGGLTVAGTASGANTLVVTGNAAISTNLVVSGTAAITSNLTANGITISSNGLSVSGTTSGSNTLVVTGNAAISTNLVVSGTAAVTSSLTANGISVTTGGISVSTGGLSVAGTTSGSNTLVVTGNAAISTNLVVSGTAAITSNLTANGITISSKGLSVSGTTSGSNTLVVTGNAAISTNLVVSGTAAVTSSLTANGISVSTGGLSVAGTVSGNTNSLIVTGTAAVTSSLTANGITISSGGLTVNASQTINFNGIAPSMSGANIVAGTIPPAAINGGVGSNNLSSGLNVTGNYLSTGYCGNFAGNVVATSYNATSDRRLKSNVESLSSQWNAINKIEPVTFDWIANGRPDIGFIAQNVYNAYPQLRPNYETMDPTSNLDEPLDLSGNPLYYAIDYGRMTPFLWQGMREIMQRVELLESENAQLKTRIQRIESAIH